MTLGRMDCLFISTVSTRSIRVFHHTSPICISNSFPVSTRTKSSALILHLSSNHTNDEKHEGTICVVLGDLHLSPIDMELHNIAQKQILDAVELLKKQHESIAFNQHVVSLGDLGAKEPFGFSGTTESFQLAHTYLSNFNIPFSLITGNHDLEGLSEFDSDKLNLQAWAHVFKHTGVMSPEFNNLPVFRKDLGHAVLLGLSTIRFRDSPGSSHEVYIDDDQIRWFEQQLEQLHDKHVFVFTHAPPMGCNLRVLSNVHVKNLCAWLNHSAGRRRRRVFINLAKRYPCVKAWFSGHFHLSHDFEDSVTLLDEQCTFVQCGVIGEDSARDERRQTRILLSFTDKMCIYSVNHHQNGRLRLDATVSFDSEAQRAHMDIPKSFETDRNPMYLFKAYTPRPYDGCYLEEVESNNADGEPQAVMAKKVCWWHTSRGIVLGVHDGMILEYDEETLDPVGVVMTKDELDGRDVFWIAEADALIVVPPRNGSDVEVVHPNEDGTYARKYQLNKRFRIETKQREKIAKTWIQNNFPITTLQK
uniref:Calcineurin-like phosphoesterase domain-containing protein n=1 Tax=Timspurckia oligopyrenoides TaxID=708627 RepID=A0A7S1ERX7_9RHOD